MKSFFILIIIIFFSIPEVLSQSKKVVKIRKQYYKATQSEKAVKEFYQHFKNHNYHKPVLDGYKSMASFLMAENALNPYSKYSYFEKGKKILEKAIDQAPENIELRFLRFTVQTNLPSFLGYKEAIEKDKHKIIKAFQTHSINNDKDLKNRIIEYMKKTDYCSKNELNILTSSS